MFRVASPLIVGVGVLVLLQTLVIVILLVQRARRLRIEQAHDEGQRRYALATAAGAVGVWDWNVATNEIYVDTRLKALLGFDDAEISTRPDDWGSRVHPLDAPRAAAQVKACLDGHSDVYEIEHRMLHKDGSVRWFLSRGSAVRGADGRLQRLVGTKVDITQRKWAEEAIHESEANLQASHREILNLAGRLIASQDLERARLARDLHDDISQQVAGLSIAFSGVKRRVGALASDGDMQKDMTSLQQRIFALAENIRHLSHDLHPSVLEHSGLVAALAAYCQELQRRHTVRVTFSAEGDFDATEANAALCVYRVAQEGLRNVVTHSAAEHAEVRLVSCDGAIELTVVDDGHGFDVAEIGKNAKGLGLLSIKERVRLVGGTVSIVTELTKGTRLLVQIPPTPAR